ncbi:MAG: nucleoside recognition domain-containing protein [Armatimonadota bacterium]
MGGIRRLAVTALDVLRSGVLSGVKTTVKLARVIVPVYFAVVLLKHTALMGMISRTLAPVMSVFGLPGEAATAIVLGNVVSLYSALAAVQALHMTPQQVTIVGLMIVVSHNLPSEYVVLRGMGAPAGLVTAARVMASLAAGAIAGAILR